MLQSYRNICFIKVSRWTWETEFLNGRLSCNRVLEKDRCYYSGRISVLVDFIAALHRNPVVCVFCSAPTPSSFSRTSPGPACCKEDLWARRPEVCLGAGFTPSQNPLRKISANPCLKGLLLREPEQVFQIRLHARCNMSLNIFLLLPWVISIGMVILWQTYSGFTSIQKVEVFDGCALP